MKKLIQQIYTILTVLLFMWQGSVVIAQCNHPDDYTALRALYLATDGDNWTIKTGWPTRAQFLVNPTPPIGTDMSGWYGIVCGGLNRIQLIYLGENNLNGELPNLNINYLNVMRIDENNLSGQIPDFNFPIIETLDLSNNKLSGNIPNFSFPNLRTLDLSLNLLSGEMPNFNLPKLKLIELSYNNLSGNIPNLNLPELGALWISDNKFSGSLPNFNLPKLYQIVASNNKLSGTIPDFNIPNLYVINLGFNNFSLCYPQSYKILCDSIEVEREGDPGKKDKKKPYLYLFGNPLLPWQGDFTQFCATDGSQQAQIGAPCDNGNPADGTNDVIQDDCRCGLLPPCNHPDFAPLLALYNSTNGLDWTNKTGWEDGAAGTNCDPCNFNGQPWYGLHCKSGRVEIIALHNNNLSGFLPRGDTLAELDFLRSLSLTNNNISGNIPSGLGNIKSLESIEIIGNLLTGLIPENLGKAKNLRYINLRSNKISGVIPDSLMTLGNLYFLDLRTNNLTGSIPININKLKSLSIIDLYGNRLSGNIPTEIGELSKLGTLNIGNNNLSGSIPDEICNLTKLRNLDISNNKIIESIPFNIGNLSLLRWLNLSGNLLTGSIPESIGNVVDSCFIILNNNNLSECFPNVLKKFCGKNFQSYFNPLLPWQGDFAKFCATDGSQQAQVGVPCNNGNPADGTNDVIDQNCNCVPCPTIIATITGTNAICQGESSTFTAIGGASYIWSNGATTADITVNTAGTYSVTVTNANGCEANGERILTINAGPTASINGANEICEGSSTEFTATGGVSYVWNTTATTDKITVAAAGFYSVTVTDANGCTSSIDKTLAVNNAPTATITGTNAVCQGESATFTALGGISYIWSNGSTTADITVNAAGTYSVTVTNVANCEAKGEKILTVYASPTAAIIGANEICEGSSAEFTATGGVSYLWNTTATTDKITVNTAGSYSVTVTDANGCTSENTKTMAVTNAPSATITGTNVVCPGESTTFTATGGTSYLWSNGATTADIIVNVAGTYSVTVTSMQGCYSTGSTILTLSNTPTVEIKGVNEICEGETTILTASGGTSYVWNTGATSKAIQINSGGIYTASVTNNNGCVGNTSFRVTLLDDTKLSQTKNDTLYVDQGSSYQVDLLKNDILFTDSIKVQLVNIPEAFIRVLSFDEKGRISLEVKEVFIETLEIGYEVCDPCNPCVSGKLIILNEKLKEITQTTLITTSQSTNNTLQFSSEPIPDSELWIYNRWGQQILHSKNYQNDWDANGYPGGVYYYVFKVYGFTIKRALTVVK